MNISKSSQSIFSSLSNSSKMMEEQKRSDSENANINDADSLRSSLKEIKLISKISEAESQNELD